MENAQTIRGLAHRILEAAGTALSHSDNFVNDCFGPRPEPQDNAKDSRDDLRSLLEKAAIRLEANNAQMERIGREFGIASYQQGSDTGPVQEQRRRLA